MLVVCVNVHVKQEHCAEFIEASLNNARCSREEPGVAQFDVLQQADDPTRFVLYEVYRDEAGAKAHKETSHYARWAEAVAPWMAEPRKSIKYRDC
jgi:(4S)-4-hydroxy-5-phosphonooxypentane-2,3-dione isomerase